MVSDTCFLLDFGLRVFWNPHTIHDNGSQLRGENRHFDTRKSQSCKRRRSLHHERSGAQYLSRCSNGGCKHFQRSPNRRKSGSYIPSTLLSKANNITDNMEFPNRPTKPQKLATNLKMACHQHSLALSIRHNHVFHHHLTCSTSHRS